MIDVSTLQLGRRYEVTYAPNRNREAKFTGTYKGSYGDLNPGVVFQVAGEHFPRTLPLSFTVSARPIRERVSA